MSTYHNVLVAIDPNGSPEQVLARAASVVDKATDSVHILSVFSDPAYIYASYPVFSAGASTFDWEGLRQENRENMSKIAEKAGFKDANIIAEYGPATHVILEQAAELGADLIIVGSHGRHGVALLLGSTANGILHRAECDVLAVRIKK